MGQLSNHHFVTVHVYCTVFRRTLLDTVNGSYTIFAPSDDAFARLHPSLLQRLQNGDIECAASMCCLVDDLKITD